MLYVLVDYISWSIWRCGYKAGACACPRTYSFPNLHTHEQNFQMVPYVCSVSSPKIVCLYLYLDYINWKLRDPHGDNNIEHMRFMTRHDAHVYIPYIVQISSIFFSHHLLSVQFQFCFPIKVFFVVVVIFHCWLAYVYFFYLLKFNLSIFSNVLSII